MIAIVAHPIDDKVPPPAVISDAIPNDDAKSADAVAVNEIVPPAADAIVGAVADPVETTIVAGAAEAAKSPPRLLDSVVKHTTSIFTLPLDLAKHTVDVFSGVLHSMLP